MRNILKRYIVFLIVFVFLFVQTQVSSGTCLALENETDISITNEVSKETTETTNEITNGENDTQIIKDDVLTADNTDVVMDEAVASNEVDIVEQEVETITLSAKEEISVTDSELQDEKTIDETDIETDVLPVEETDVETGSETLDTEETKDTSDIETNIDVKDAEIEAINDTTDILENEINALTLSDFNEENNVNEGNNIQLFMMKGGAVINSFETLKAAIEDPSGASEIVVPRGDYLFKDTITVDRQITLKNPEGETVKFIFGLENESYNNLGKTMIDIVSGGNLILSPDSDDNFIFTGRKDNAGEKIKTNTSDKGLFITVREDAELTINNGVFCDTYNSGMQTAPIFVDGGTFTLNDGRIENNNGSHVETLANVSLSPREDINNGYAVSAGVAIRKGGTFTMNGGSITNNTFNHGHGAGGVAIQGGTAVINDGQISSNTVYENGGAIFFDWVSEGTINDGTFTGNTVSGMGGAIVTFDRYMLGDENGSAILNNLATGLTHEKWIKHGLGVKLAVNGGTFSDNKAFAGGAFYISSNDTEINAATITNNEATRFGGGIYLSTVPYVLQMRNVLIEENLADDSMDVDISGIYNGQTIKMPSGSGGGVWYCPTGDSEVYISNGVAFLYNSATHDGDDFTSVLKKPGEGYFATVYERMLGGGFVNWYKDGDSQDSSVPRYDGSQDPISPLINSEESNSLKAINNELSSEELARKFATVIMSGNVAGRGGAIGSNGTVIFGDKDKEFSASVQKQWSSKITDAEKKPVIVGLYVVVDGTEYLIQKIELNEGNNWQYTFDNLPLEAGNNVINYKVLELGNEYNVAYENNEFTTANFTHGVDTIVKVTNNKKQEDIPTTNLEEPNKPTDSPKPTQNIACPDLVTHSYTVPNTSSNNDIDKWIVLFVISFGSLWLINRKQKLN